MTNFKFWKKSRNYWKKMFIITVRVYVFSRHETSTHNLMLQNESKRAWDVSLYLHDKKCYSNWLSCTVSWYKYLHFEYFTPAAPPHSVKSINAWRGQRLNLRNSASAGQYGRCPHWLFWFRNSYQSSPWHKTQNSSSKHQCFVFLNLVSW